MRYDFSFPPKIFNGSSNASSSTHTIQNRGHYNHFNSNGGAGSSMSKSGSTSLLSCAPPHTSMSGGGNSTNSRYRGQMASSQNGCYGCVGRTEQPNRHHHHHHHHTGGHQFSNGGRQRNQYSGGQQYQQQQSYSSNNSSSMGTAPMSSGQQTTNGIGAPGTPKDGNCSFSNYFYYLGFIFLFFFNLTELDKNLISIRRSEKHTFIHGRLAFGE